MNTTYRRVATRFERETRFEVKPATAAPFRVTQETELGRLKDRMLRARLARVSYPEIQVRLRHAANEAAALAWVTAFPLLLFPVLFEEKSGAALGQAQRQARVRERSRELVAV